MCCCVYDAKHFSFMITIDYIMVAAALAKVGTRSEVNVMLSMYNLLLLADVNTLHSLLHTFFLHLLGTFISRLLNLLNILQHTCTNIYKCFGKLDFCIRSYKSY